MKRKKLNYLIIFIIVIVDVAIIYFGSDFLADYKLGLTSVYVTRITLPARELIKEEYLKEIKVPKAYVNEEVCLLKEDIIGKYVSLDTTIPKGSLIYQDAIDDISDMKDAPHFNLRKNEVTYDLFVKDISVNPAHLLSGMNVDLYLTINRKEIVSDLLISNARIIGLYDVNNKEIKNYDINSTLGTISIAINKDYVAYLNKAIAIGEVNLIVGENIYADLDSKLNESSIVIDYLR